jgi:predicted Zn finger-like uncharacterized protein
MFTVCPKCALTLVVTAADLRVAQGYVRCGRCLNVFNALPRLSEDRPSAAPEPVAEAASPTPAQPTPAPTPEKTSPRTPEEDGSEPATQSSLEETGEIEIELDASALLASTQARAAPEEPAEPASEPAAQETPGPQEHSAEEARTAPAEPPPPRESVAEAPPGPASEAGTAADRDGAAGGALAAPASAGADSPSWTAEPSVAAEAAALATAPLESVSPEAISPQAADAQQTNSAQEQTESPFESRGRRSPAGLAWNIAASVLALALALQIVNHYRDALAAHPALRRPLSDVYSALGVRLAPHWNVHAYDVRQLGASVEGAAAGEIIVRASVKNSASHAQPLPLLRVTLQDRFGNRIAARDVPPSDYLPSSAAPSALLAAGGRVDATMAFVDPGPQAVGFEIDACLRQRGGAVACAHGP